MPLAETGEALVVEWLKTSGFIAGVDPVGYDLMEADAKTIQMPRHMEGYVVHWATMIRLNPLQLANGALLR